MSNSDFRAIVVAGHAIGVEDYGAAGIKSQRYALADLEIVVAIEHDEP